MMVMTRMKSACLMLLPLVLLLFLAVPAFAQDDSSSADAIGLSAKTVATTGQPVVLTEEEQAYIADHPMINIAMDTSWIPYAWKDARTGEVKGILVNFFDLVCGRAGLTAEYVACDSYQDAIQTVRSGKTDLVSGIANDSAMAAKNDVLITDPYVNISYCIVSKGTIPDLFAEGATYRVAVCGIVFDHCDETAHAQLRIHRIPFK